MSATRDNARRILDAALPPGVVITSNGPTGPKYTELTGIAQKTLTDNWATGGIMTGCNGFTGWYGGKMGSKLYMGVFDLKGLASKAGKPNAWIESTATNRPSYGDMLRHASFHVDVCLGFDGDVLLRAAAGQGGKAAGGDILKRLRGTSAYDHKKLVGWIDVDLYFDSAATVASPQMGWLHGWWSVSDGSNYYYYFFPDGRVQYTKSNPLRQAPPPSFPLNSGRYTYVGQTLTLVWDPADGGTTRETFTNATLNTKTMKATSNRYGPLTATRI